MKQVTPETTQEYMTQLKRFNMGAPGESDCPVFDGMYEYFAVGATHTFAAFLALEPCRQLGRLGRAGQDTAAVMVPVEIGWGACSLWSAGPHAVVQEQCRCVDVAWQLSCGAVLPLCCCLQLLSGGSVDGAAFLAAGKAEIAFNWAGVSLSSSWSLLHDDRVHGVSGGVEVLPVATRTNPSWALVKGIASSAVHAYPQAVGLAPFAQAASCCKQYGQEEAQHTLASAQ
jgi:hypothetical protein